MKKNTIILCIIILAAAFMLAVYAVFFHFLQKEIRATNEKETQIALLKDKSDEMITQKKLIDESKEMRALLEQYFVPEEEIVTFLEAFEALDDVTGTDSAIVSVNVTAPKKDAGNPTLAISLTSEGSFVGVYHMLRLIEELPYEVVVGDIQLARTSDAPEGGGLPLWRLATSFEIRSFVPAKNI